MMENLREILAFAPLQVGGRPLTVGHLLLVFALLLIGYVLVMRIKKVLVRNLQRRKFDPDLVLLIDRVFVVTAIAMLVLFALSLLNVPLAAFTFVSGALAIGVGFGAQNILNNFISGWILMWERPIRIGDFLEIGDVKGKVETINTRSTRIRRVDGVHLLIPNSQLLENTVVNWTLIDKTTRGDVRVGVAYGSPVKEVARLIKQAATEHKDILAEPAPLVLFQDFGDSALIFDLFFWLQAATERDVRVTCSDLRFRIDELFAEHGIVIAFPQQDVHLNGELKLVRPE